MQTGPGARGQDGAERAFNFMLAEALWGSMVRSQRSIALSSADSEYLALVSGACEATYLVDVLEVLGSRGSRGEAYLPH